MKRFIAIFLIAALLLCGCDILAVQQTVNDAEEALLRSIVENKALQKWIAEHPFDELAADTKDALVKQFPTLKQVLNFDNLKQTMKTTGLDLMQEYLSSAEAQTREKAETLGGVIKILCPDLADEVDAILGK